MGILRTAAVLGAGYFLYKKFNATQQAAQSDAWEDSYPAEPANAESTSSDLLAESPTDATLAGIRSPIPPADHH